MDEIDLAQETMGEGLPTFIRNDQVLDAVQELTALVKNLIEGQVKTLAAVNKMFSKMVEIETQAADMASPEKMMELANSMLGGFGGGNGKVLG